MTVNTTPRRPSPAAARSFGAEPPAGGQPRQIAVSRIAGNAAIGALSMGTWFGSSFALANWLRAAGPPHAKVFASFLLPVAGFTTALTEEALRHWSGVRATPPQEPSLGHDAVASSVFFIVNASYHGLRLPTFPATTAAGAAVTVGLSMVANGLGGAVAEAAAQATRTTAARSEIERRGSGEAQRIGIGRANGLLILAMLGQGTGALAMRGALPVRTARSLAIASSAVAAVGWTFRRVLAPAAPPVPRQADSTHELDQRIGVCGMHGIDGSG